MLSDKKSNQAAAHPPKGRSHPGSPSVARRSPRSRDIKAALTRRPMGGEAGADVCHLGIVARKVDSDTGYQCETGRYGE